MSLSADEKRARLARALEYGGGTHTVDDVIGMVRTGAAQFWEHGDGAIVTELYQYPRLKAVSFWLMSGTIPDCMALEDDIVAWARGEGCTVAISTGRKGWGRVAHKTGWRPRPNMHAFFKPLTEETTP